MWILVTKILGCDQISQSHKIQSHKSDVNFGHKSRSSDYRSHWLFCTKNGRYFLFVQNDEKFCEKNVLCKMTKILFTKSDVNFSHKSRALPDWIRKLGANCLTNHFFVHFKQKLGSIFSLCKMPKVFNISTFST